MKKTNCGSQYLQELVTRQINMATFEYKVACWTLTLDCDWENIRYLPKPLKPPILAEAYAKNIKLKPSFWETPIGKDYLSKLTFVRIANENTRNWLEKLIEIFREHNDSEREKIVKKKLEEFDLDSQKDEN